MITPLLFSAREKRAPQTNPGPFVQIQPQWVTQQMEAIAAAKLQREEHGDSVQISTPLHPSIEQDDEAANPQPLHTASEPKKVASSFSQAAGINEKIKKAGDKLKTPQEKKVWAALQELVFVQNMSRIRQLDVHNYLKEQHGKSVDSKLILPLIGDFERITGRQFKAGYQ